MDVWNCLGTLCPLPVSIFRRQEHSSRNDSDRSPIVSDHFQRLLLQRLTFKSSYEPTPPAPAPFVARMFPDDPIFNCAANPKTCAVAWAVRIIDSSTIYILGAGIYSWFSDYKQTCLLTENCQDRAFQIEESYDIWIYNLVTKAIVEMISPTGEKPTYARDNKNGFLSSILAWLGGASKTSGNRVFKGFRVYELDYWLTDMLLPTACNNALVQMIMCDDIVSTWTSANYASGFLNRTVTDSVCDAGCGKSLAAYWKNVVESCAGYQIEGYPTTVPAGYMWQQYNETCLKDTTTGKYCNGRYPSVVPLNTRLTHFKKS